MILIQFGEEYTTFTVLMPLDRNTLTPTMFMFKIDLRRGEYTGSKVHEKTTFQRIGFDEDIHGQVKFDQQVHEEFYFMNAVNDVKIECLPKLPQKYANARPLKLYDVAADCLNYFVMGNRNSYQYGGVETSHDVFSQSVDNTIKKF